MEDKLVFELLEERYYHYAKEEFIQDDPIQVPKRFNRFQDIEIVGLWTAILSWGQRKTIINKATQLFELMDNAPYDFILNHQSNDLKRFESFVHRTFQPTDTLYFIDFFKRYYSSYHSLEDLFVHEDLEIGINHFHSTFIDHPNFISRTKKHIAAPQNKSTCKRINMFLRWMVRPNSEGIDFGIWNKIDKSTLFIPFDVHVERVANNLGLIQRKQRDWKTVKQLTDKLRQFDPLDPVKYDFALFGMGIDNPVK